MAANPVHFADANLEAAVEAQLGVSDPTPAHMLGLTTLYAQQAGISDLTGLEHAVNLTELHLWENQISDVSSLSGLTHLTALYLWSNQIEDVSPLSGLTDLTVLALPDNQIMDVSPLSGLTNLAQLYLYMNPITDIASLSGLLNLEELYLYAGQVTDVSPLAGLTNLTTLELGGNRIDDISSLSGLSNLTALFLWGNQIADVSGMSGLIHLQQLYLQSNQITDISPLSGLTSLVNLHLWENQISDVSPLSGMTHLIELALPNNQIQDISPLSGLTNLQVLYLYVNQIADITALSELANLTSLDLAENQISDISSLAGLTNLTTLELGNNQIDDISSLSELENLEGLHLYTNLISDISPLSDLTKLMVLDLKDNQISDVSPLVELTNWEALTLHGNPLDANAYCTDLHEIANDTAYADYDPNPNPPDSVTASQGTQTDQVQIAWDVVCNGPSYTTYYQVYRSTSLSATKTAIGDWQTETEFVDDAAEPGVSSYYWVRAAANDQGSFGLSAYGAPTARPVGYIDLHDAGESYRGFTPQVLRPGQDIEIYTRIENSGTNSSGPFTLDSYLSLDAQIDPSDYHLGQLEAATIEPAGFFDFRGIEVIAESVPAGDYYVGWIIDQADDVIESNENNNRTYQEGYQLTVAVLPLPSPMTWALEPNALSHTSISMTATQAIHASGVEYFFDCVTVGGHDSTWQTSPTYTDTGLQPSTQHSYRVKARDQGWQQETDWSVQKSAVTHPAPDITPPSPNPLTWALAPHAIGESSIFMIASTATDASGSVQYYFDCQTVGGHDSGWQTSPMYEDRDLSPDTTYQYRVLAQDSFGNQTDDSGWASATTDEAVRDEDTAIPLYVIGDSVFSIESTIKTYDVFLNGSIEYRRDNVIQARCKGPADLAFSRGGRYMFTVSAGSAWVQVVDTVTMTVGEEAHVTGTQEDFSGVAFDPLRELVYSVDKGQDQLYIHKWDEGYASLTLAENGRITLSGTSTHDIALDLTNDLLFVSNGTNQVHVYNAGDWSLNRIINLGHDVERIDLDEQKQMLYAGTQISGDPYLLQFDLQTSATTTQKIRDDASVVGIAVDDSSSLVYVATLHPFYIEGTNQIHVFDGELNAIGQAQVNGFIAGLGLPVDGISYSPLTVSKRIVSGAELIGGVHYVAGGDVIAYEICFANTSAGAVGRVQLVDELPVQGEYLDAELFDIDGDMLGSYDPIHHAYEISMQALEPNALRCALITVRLKDDLEAGSTVVNEVAVDSVQTPQVVAQAECVVRHNSLRLNKSVVDDPGHFVINGIHYVDRGSFVTYELCYVNNNTGPVTNVVVTDHLPEGVTWVAADPDGANGHYDAGTGTYTWQFAQLEPNASDCLQITVLIHEDLLPGEQITNRVSIQSSEVAETWASVDVITKYEPLDISKRVFAGTHANPVNGLPEFANPGDTITYTMAVANPGINPVVHNVAIIDKLPPELEYVSSPDVNDILGIYDPNFHAVTWLYPSLIPTETLTLVLEARVRLGSGPGVITNEAIVLGLEAPQTMTRVDVLVGGEIPPQPAQATLTVYASELLGGNLTDELMCVLILPPQVDLGHVDGGVDLILDPGGAEASYQIVYGKDGQVKITAYFDKTLLLDAIKGQSEVTLWVTGRLVDGTEFFGESTIPVSGNVVLQE